MFTISDTVFDGDVKILEPTKFEDYRGTFTITYLKREYEQLGIPPFVRSMRTFSRYGVLRGLHFQLEPPMGKLIEVISGSVLLAVVDIRPWSARFAQNWTKILSGQNQLQVWIPAGYAIGYFAFTDAVVQYHCDAEFAQLSDGAVAWNDPVIGIKWPVADPILSRRDTDAPKILDYFRGEICARYL